jgi:ubiquinone/menaquinone biosynthesis C-methylase UbiE
MARQNREAESEGIQILDPKPTDRIVAIGVGPGVGVEILSARVALVYAVDPSRVMVEETIRRNRLAVEKQQVVVERTIASSLSAADESFDGAIAVNTVQIFDPLGESLAEIARVLRPGAAFVTLTHDWAIEKSTNRSVADWLHWIEIEADQVGLHNLHSWRAIAESGRSVVMTLRKAI